VVKVAQAKKLHAAAAAAAWVPQVKTRDADVAADAAAAGVELLPQLYRYGRGLA